MEALAVRPCEAVEWEAVANEDLRNGRYTRADLEAYLVGVGRIACWPSGLAADVVAFIGAAKVAAFAARIREIQTEGLTDVRREGDGRTWRVRYVDETPPVIILETMLADPEPTTLEDLERSMESNRRLDPAGRGSTARSFLRRIEALRAGLPDPNPPPAPSPERREIRSLVDLAGWHFSARAGGRPSARTCEDSPAATASPAPALCLCLCDPT